MMFFQAHLQTRFLGDPPDSTFPTHCHAIRVPPAEFPAWHRPLRYSIWCCKCRYKNFIPTPGKAYICSNRDCCHQLSTEQAGCETCHYDLYWLLFVCWACETEKPIYGKFPRRHSHRSWQFERCKTCNMEPDASWTRSWVSWWETRFWHKEGSQTVHASELASDGCLREEQEWCRDQWWPKTKQDQREERWHLCCTNCSVS